MKKIRLILSAVLILISFYACNNGEEKKTDSINENLASQKIDLSWVASTLDSLCADGNGIGNFILDSAKADWMIKKFDTVYGKDRGGENIGALIRDYWIDSCTIYAVAAFLNSSSAFDGVRFNFGASTINDSGTYPKPPYQNKTTFFIIPTGKSATGHADSSHILIPQLGNCASPFEFIKPFSVASSSIAVYENVYHKNAPVGKDSSLSKGIWIDACVIRYMATIIKKSGATVDGISVHTAAYTGSETRLPRGTKQKYASTIVMVPTSPDGANHSDNWAVIKEIIIQLQKKNVAAFGAGLNHGELCPTSCN